MKKSTLTIITLALVLVNVVLSVLLTFSLVSTNKKTDALITKIAALIDLDIANSAGSGNNNIMPGINDLEVVDVAANSTSNKISLSVSDKSGKVHYVVITATVTLNKQSKDYETLRPSVDTNMKLIVSTISNIVSSYSYEDLLPKKGEMSEEILKALQDSFKSDIIYDFSFGDYIVQ